jgi:RimJ/RimL family protein N-acetyltransferase
VFLGEKTRLRCLRESDLDNCMAWVNDSEVTKFLMMRMPISRKQEEMWLQRAMAGESSTEKVLAVETLDGEYLGNIGLHHIDYISGVAEIGIAIGKKEYWGKGYGPDAMRSLLKFAFRELGLRKVILKVFGSNIRAQKAYAKLGFEEVGRLRAHILKNGHYEDEIYMEVFADELK